MEYQKLRNQLAEHAKNLIAEGTTQREDIEEQLRQEHETGIAAEVDGQLQRTAPEPRDPDEFAEEGLPNGVAVQRAILDEAIQLTLKDAEGITT